MGHLFFVTLKSDKTQNLANWDGRWVHTLSCWSFHTSSVTGIAVNSNIRRQSMSNNRNTKTWGVVWSLHYHTTQNPRPGSTGQSRNQSCQHNWNPPHPPPLCVGRRRGRSYSGNGPLLISILSGMWTSVVFRLGCDLLRSADPDVGTLVNKPKQMWNI